ncbi:MAG: PIG-L family deacetylase [Anaerolineales bacterium]|jgi:LmbE family N-acetylglucosaminyl deacetylase
MRWIYISPHLDDAVLSAGGCIYEQTKAGIPVEIWTIVCGYPPPGELTPLAQVIHFQWGTGTAEETTNLRRAEDLKAADIVGAKTVHFNIPDCIYRRGPDGEPLYLKIFTQPHPAEAHLPDEIASAIAPGLEADDQVICQLGIGGHADHILVRQAAEQLNRPLWYTADVPYVFNQPGELASKVAGMKESHYNITEAGLRAWIEASLAYESQLSSLFDSTEDLDEKIHSYYSKSAGFTMWYKN